MATDLTGLKVKDTYNSLLKIGDNSSLSATPDKISDGLGNESILYLSTSQVSIGTLPATGYDLTVNSATKTGSIDIVGAATAATLRLTGGSGSQGTLSWNTDEETVDIIQNGATLQVGQEVQVHVKNQTGSTITDGTPVYVTGTLGASGRLTVAPMIADGTIEAKYFLGITTEDIPNGEDGKVTTFGKIRGLDTTAYSEGQTLYVSASTAGAFQTTAPVAPNLDLEVAIVINVSANNGTIFVRAQNGYYLGLLHDVYLNSPANNQFLVYNSTTSRWENQAISSVGSINLDTVTDNGNTTTNDINVGDISAGNMTLSGYLRGAANFVIDPAAYGDETGVVQILGDLRVDGTTTTINSTTVTIDDKNIVLASGSATAADANGAGLTIDGASATMTYNSTSDSFVFNKKVNSKQITIDNNVSTGGFGSFDDYQILLYNTLTANTSYGIGIESNNFMFNSDGSYRFYVDNSLKVSINSSGNITANSFIGSLTGNADTASALATARNIAIDGAVTGNADFDGSGDITISTTVNHNHNDLYYTETESDARFVNVTGDTMTGNLNFSDTGEGITWTMNTDGASIKFYNTGDSDTDSRLEFQTTDNDNEYFRWTHRTTGTTTAYELMRLTGNGSGGTLDIAGELDINGSTVIDSSRNISVTSAVVKGLLNLTTAGAELQVGGVEVIDVNRNITANSLTTDSISGSTIDIDASTAINLKYNGSTQLRIDSTGVAYLGTVTFANDGISLTDEDSTIDSFFHANVDYDAGLYTVTSNARYGADYIQVDGLDSREETRFTISPKDIGDPDPHAYLYIGGDNSITAPNTLVDWHTIYMNALSVKINNNEVATQSWVNTNTLNETEGDNRYLQLTGGTLTGNLSINTGTNGSSTNPYYQYDRIIFNNQFSDVARGANKIVFYDDAWLGGIGVHTDTVAYYSGGEHIWYESNGTNFNRKMRLTDGGSLITEGRIGIQQTPKNNLHIANNVSSGGFSNYTDYQILLYDVGTAPTSYGIGIEGDTLMFNSDKQYRFYSDNTLVMTITDGGSIENNGNVIAGGNITADGNLQADGVISIGTTSTANEFNFAKDHNSGTIMLVDNPNTGNVAYTEIIARNAGGSNDIRIGSSANYFQSEWQGGWVFATNDLLLKSNSNVEVFAGGTADSNIVGTFTSTGLGIGTGSPSVKLHVEGSSIIANNTAIDPDSYTNKTIAGAIADGSGWALASAVGGNVGAGTSWAVGVSGTQLYMGFGDGTNANSMQTFLNVSGRNVHLVPDGGNVGIGTNSPQVYGSGMEIKTGTQSGLRLTSTTIGGGSIEIGADSGQGYIQNIIAGDFTRFYVSNSTVSDTLAMSIKSNGSVGIGQSDPSYTLDVRGTVQLGNTEGNNNVIRMGVGTNAVYMGAANINTINVAYDVNDDYNLHINYNGYQSGATQYRNLVVNDGRQGLIARFVGSTGNVGIANSTPPTKLAIGSNLHTSPDDTNRILNWWGNTEIANSGHFITAGNSDASTDQPRSVGLSLFNRSTANNTWSPAITFNGIGSSGQYMNAGAAIAAQLKNNTGDTNFKGGDIVFFTQHTDLAGRGLSEKMRLTSNGNLAIGTATTSAKLEVKSSGSTLTNNIKFGDSTVGYLASGSTGVYLSDNSGTARLMFTHTGNVGIGTTSPATKLDVNGAGTFVGNIALITDATSGNYSLIQHKYNGVAKAYSGYNSGFALYGGETDIATRIQSGGQYVITALTSGNVGIGTTSPSQKLHISNASTSYALAETTGTGTSAGFRMKGSASADYTLFTTQGINQFGIYDNAAAAERLRIDSSGNTSIYSGTLNLGTDSVASAINSIGDLFILNVDSNNNTGGTPNFRFRIGSTTDIATINSTGLGIGTTNVNAPLHVYGKNQTNGTLELTPNIAKGGYASYVHYGTSGDWYIRSANASGKIILQDTGGNVGIGTTSPSGKLHVDSGIAHNNIYFTTGSSGGTGYDVRLYLNGGANNSEMSINMGIVGNEDRDRIRTYQGNMYFRTNDSENMTINSAGNVGIGNTSPSAKLQVQKNGDNGSGGSGEYAILANASSGQATIGAIHTAGGYANLNLGSTGSGSGLEFWHISYRQATEKKLQYYWYSGGFTSRFEFFTNGDFKAAGDVVAYSDARLKENVKTIDNALDKVLAMRGVSYNRIEDEDKSRKIGVIAQEVEQVLPEVVSQEGDGMKSVAYGNIVGVLIEAIKEQQKQIDELKAIINGGS